jgi:hypothetical protein
MSKIFSIGLVRGLIWQVLGTAVGFGLFSAIRAVLGLSYWAEPAWVFGGLIGALAFMVGVGAFTDWFRWMKGEDAPDPEEITDPPGWQKYAGVSYDHKVIGVQYVILSLVLLVVGGTFALIFRTELANTGMQLLNFIQFNTLIGLHGMVLIASMLLGGAAIGNYTLPLLIGARDMAFPRLNAFAFWLAVPGSLLVLMSMPLGGFETGWTGYPPLSTRGPMGVQLFFLGVFIVGWSSVLGGLNLIATTLRMRAPGMGGAGDFDDHPDCDTVDRSLVPIGDVRAPAGDAFLRSDARRQPDFVPAPVLVLLAPGGVYLRPARFWRHLRTAAGIRAQASIRLQVDRSVLYRYRRDWLPGLGAPYVRRRDGRIPARAVYVQHVASSRAHRRQSSELDGDHVAGQPAF